MLVEKIVPLFVIFGVTLFLKRKQVFLKNDGQIISKLLMNIVLPATIVNAFASVTFTPNVLLLPVVGAGIVIILLGIGYLLSIALDTSAKTRRTFFVVFPTLEGGTVAYPLMLAVFGQAGLVPTVLFDVGNALCFFSVIFLIGHTLNRGKGEVALTAGLRELSKSPIIWAFLLGILMNLCHISLPAFSAVVNVISPATQLLIMITLALAFEPSFSALRLPMLTILLKTGIGFSVGVIITLLLHIGGVAQVAIIISACLPPCLLTLIYFSDGKLDGQYIATLLSLALPCAFLFDIGLIYFMGIN